MRRKLVAGNWKMNGLVEEGLRLGEEIAQRMHSALEPGYEQPDCDLLVCPPFTLLHPLRPILGGSGVALGAQNCHEEAAGAYTGEISPTMLADLGCSHVILGHSERRHYFAETDGLVRGKAAAAIAAGLTPIICVGETETERDAGRALEVIATQTAESLPDSVVPARLVVAYEPVWAIGTGRTALPSDIATAHAEVRRVLADRLGEEAAARVRVLYGGSVKPENAEELTAVEGVDGALVGGASLKGEDFWAIYRAFGRGDRADSALANPGLND